MLVDATAVPGDLITNQATVSSAEVPLLLTDGDGNPATGPEPTVVVVGDAQQLSIIKEVSVVNGGPALAGETLEYVVTVRNIASVPAYYVVITDDLDDPNPGYLTYVDQSATMNGLAAGVSVAGSVITADYDTEYGAARAERDDRPALPRRHQPEPAGRYDDLEYGAGDLERSAAVGECDRYDRCWCAARCRHAEW